MKIRGQYVYPPEERIKKHITIDDNGCWIWNGSKRGGYGRLIVGSRSNGSRHSETAHRYSWLVFKGEIDRKSTRLNSSHLKLSRMPSSA